MPPASAFVERRQESTWRRFAVLSPASRAECKCLSSVLSSRETSSPGPLSEGMGAGDRGTGDGTGDRAQHEVTGHQGASWAPCPPRVIPSMLLKPQKTGGQFSHPAKGSSQVAVVLTGMLRKGALGGAARAPEKRPVSFSASADPGVGAGRGPGPATS